MQVKTVGVISEFDNNVSNLKINTIKRLNEFTIQ